MNRSNLVCGFVLMSLLFATTGAGAAVVESETRFIARELLQAKFLSGLTVVLSLVPLLDSAPDGLSAATSASAQVGLNCYVGAFDDTDGDNQFTGRKNVKGNITVRVSMISKGQDETVVQLQKRKFKTRSDGFFILSMMLTAEELAGMQKIEVEVDPKKGQAQALSMGCSAAAMNS